MKSKPKITVSFRILETDKIFIAMLGNGSFSQGIDVLLKSIDVGKVKKDRIKSMHLLISKLTK